MPAVLGGKPSAGTGCRRVDASTGDFISTRTSLKPAAAAKKLSVSGCSGFS
jgi:hypothetical protein